MWVMSMKLNFLMLKWVWFCGMPVCHAHMPQAVPHSFKILPRTLQARSTNNTKLLSCSFLLHNWIQLCNWLISTCVINNWCTMVIGLVVTMFIYSVGQNHTTQCQVDMDLKKHRNKAGMRKTQEHYPTTEWCGLHYGLQCNALGSLVHFAVTFPLVSWEGCHER